MSDEKELLINDLFHTFQGEGKFSGCRALFVRMPFCNLACDWCDTSFNTYQKVTEKQFQEFTQKEACRFAVVTGGEPLLNKHTPRVVAILKEQGFFVAAETNGTVIPNADFDFITVSPKRFTQRDLVLGDLYQIHDETFKLAHEFKYVVDRFFDFSVLARHDVFDGRRYSLSPEFNEFSSNLHKIFSFIQDHPGWRISLQTHKVMNIA